MTRSMVVSVALGVALTFSTGCSPEAKAKRELDKYAQVFDICKDITKKEGMKPGEHPCGKISTMALEMSLKDTGLPESEWRKLLEAWIKDKGYSDYYVPPSDPRRAKD